MLPVPAAIPVTTPVTGCTDVAGPDALHAPAAGPEESVVNKPEHTLRFPVIGEGIGLTVMVFTT